MVLSGRPKISFVTATFNAAATIADTIGAVEREAAGIPHEHLFIDAASTDETLAVIRGLKGEQALITSEPDQGVYDAMNKGIAKARGEWIALINGDDFYLPGAVRDIMALADRSPTTTVIHGDMVVANGDSRTRITPGLGWRGRLGLRHPMCHPTMFARSEVYARHGAYDIRYRVAADQDFFFRIIDGGERIEYLPREITLMRAGGLSGRFYDLGTRELLAIHRSRRNLVGKAAQLVFYGQRRLKSHPDTPNGVGYASWAVRDFVLGGSGLSHP